MADIFRRIVAGGPRRPTRLHTERGELIPLREMRHIPRVTVRKISSIVTQRRPDEPWWPMSAIPAVEAVISASSRVIEFGSGSSTVWLAKRAGIVISIEDNSEWQSRVSARLNELNLYNAEVRYAKDASFYDLESLSDFRFDLAVIDGSYRWKCAQAVLPLIKPGGAVYLDNSDADKDKSSYPDPSMHHRAQVILEEYATSHPNSTLTRFPSLINGEMHAGEGMLLRLG